MRQLDLFPPMEEDNQFTLFPVPEKKNGSLDISVLFQKPAKQEHLLPAAFDDQCRKCEKKMKRVPCPCWSERQPYATFYCEGCMTYLYIFVALPKPLMVWSDKIRGVINFSELVEKLLADREEKSKVRALRAGE